MDFEFSFSELEKLFPISFVVDRQGKLVHVSTQVAEIFESKSRDHDFNQFFSLKNNPHFLFSFNFYKFNPGCDFVFECAIDGQEYCFSSVYNEKSQTLLFLAQLYIQIY